MGSEFDKRVGAWATKAWRALALVWLLCVVVTVYAEPMEWANSNGKFKIKAEFVKLAGGKVTLKKSDGGLVEIPLDKLSKVCQERAKSMSEEGTPDSPFEEESPSAPSPFQNEEEEPANEPPIYHLSHVEKWGYVPDGARKKAPQPAPDAKTKSKSKGLPPAISLQPPKRANRYSTPRLDCGKALFLWDRGEALIPIEYGFEVETVYRYDLRTGKTLGTLRFLNDMLPEYASPSGDLLIVPGSRYRQAVVGGAFKWANGVYRPAYALPGFTKDYGDKPLFAFCAGGIGVFVNAKQSQVVVAKMDLEKATVSYILDIPSRGSSSVDISIAASPTGKHFAVGAPPGIYLVRAADGQVVASIEKERAKTTQNLHFSPDGSRLASFHYSRPTVFDLTTGNEEPLPESSHYSSRSMWASSDHLLVDDDELLDLSTGEMICRYAVATTNSWSRTPFKVHDGRVWGFLRNADDSVSLVNGSALPDGLEEFSKAPVIDPERAVLAPGSKVALVVESSIPAVRDRLVVSLRQRIEQSGFEVVANADKAFVASVAALEPRKLSIRGKGPTDASYSPLSVSLRMMNGVDTAWEESSDGRLSDCPNHEMTADETPEKRIADYVADREKWFSLVEIPKMIAPRGERGFGKPIYLLSKDGPKLTW